MTGYRRLWPDGVAIGSTAIALFLSLWLEPIIHWMIGAFFYITVAINTWYGGVRSGLITIILSMLALNYYFMSPPHQISISNINDALRLGLFALVSLMIMVLTHNLRQNKQTVEHLNHRLVDDSVSRLKIALNAAQMGMWDWDIVTGQICWSPEHEQLFGLSIGSFDGRYETFDACLYADDRPGLNQAIARSLHDRVPYHHEFRVRWSDGSLHWIEGWGQAFYNEAGHPIRMLGTVIAIDERKQAQLLLQQQLEQQRLVMEMSQRIRQSLQLHDILQTTVNEVRQFLHIDRVIVFQFTPGWGGTVMVESVVDPTLAILPSDIHDPCVGSQYLEPFKQGLVTAKADIYNADITPCHIEFLAQFQIRANLVVPILKDNKLWGLLAAHHCQAPREWQESEIELLRQIASQVSIALQQSALLEQVQTELTERKQAEAALQQLNLELEQRVTDRTAELTTTNEHLLNSLLALQQAQQETEDLYNNAPCGYHSLNADGVIIRINQTELDWLGYTRDEVVHQKKFVDLVTLESQAVFHENFARFLQQGWINNLEFELLNKDGSTRWVNLNSTATYDAAGQFLMSRTILFDINDRKQIEADRSQTEAALRDSEAKFRQLAENIEAVFWMRDGQKPQVIYVSPAYETIWQQSCDSLYHDFSNWIKSIHPEDHLRVETAALQLTSVGHYDQEYRILRPDGSTRWIRDRAFSIKDETGKLLRIAGLAEDISDRKRVEDERKQAEVALQQQTRQKQLLWNITQKIRQSLDLEVILNAAVTEVRQLLDVDRTAVYRFNPDWNGDFVVESVTDQWVKLVEPNVDKVWEDTYLQETQGGRFQNHETLTVTDIYTANLQPCHIELLEQFQARAYAIAPIFVGDSLWGLLALYQNAAPYTWEIWEIELLQQIASQMAIAIQQSHLYSQLQVELRDRKQATAILREAERRWRSLLDNVQLIVVGLDHSGNVNYVNPCFLSLTGYLESEVVGKNWFEHFLPPSRQAIIQTVFLDILTHNTYPYYQDFILTKSGEERFIAWNNTLLQDSNGAVIGTISIGEDITERQKVEAMKDEFIGIVSHELRTPLTAIQMSLGLLKTGIYAKKPEKSQRMIEIALTDTSRLVNLVNDILDLERLESGRAVLEKTVCRAAELMQQAVDGVQAIATQQNIRLTVAPTNATVWAAPDPIIQTLTNLLSNAIKFSSAHSVIRLGAERQLDDVLFQVSDQGRGIPADKLETIFGRFQQVDASDSREKGGTGLGLPICRSIVERHGGKIWVESTLGEGSTFFFTLPTSPQSTV
ncbi:MAG: PAS domain-containing protein [Oculatellaceae cyanobacterium bins.114]|nr:PAS domain-containing protein [Oculatellaceae cyanobacterium bins.114]